MSSRHKANSTEQKEQDGLHEIPRSSLGHLPCGWASAYLPELIAQDGELSDGDWVESKDQDPQGDVRLIQLADVGDGHYRDRSDRFLTSNKAKELRCTFLKTSDVLVARLPDPLGRACIFPGDPKPSVTVVDVCIVRPGKEGVSCHWLMHTVNAPWFRTRVVGKKAGSGRLRISKKNLTGIPLPVPPLGEQDRIADRIDELFSDLAAGVAALERVRRNLKRYRAAVLHAAVTGRLTAAWRAQQGPAKETGPKLLERILAERRRQWEQRTLAKYANDGREPPKNWRERYLEPASPNLEDLAELPEEWCWTHIDHCADVQGGLQKSPARKPVRNHYPYLRVANVLRGRLDLTDLTRFELEPEELERLRLLKGDLLIVEGNGSVTEIGRSALWHGEVNDCVHQNHSSGAGSLVVWRPHMRTSW